MGVRIKADWIPFLHRFRRRELEWALGDCPERTFRSALELGAGDGFQSRLLTRWADHVVATDHDPGIARQDPANRVAWRVCDAEVCDAVFAGRRFDLIFSSSLMEHLPDPGRVLRACHALLDDEGLMIHIIPAPFWKVTHMLLHAPNRASLILERLLEPGGPARVLRRLSGKPMRPSGVLERDNNPGTPRPPRPAWRRLLVPVPHGVSRGHIEELLAFRRSRWIHEITAAGFDLVAVRRGPVASGYGFGLDRTRHLLERLGFASEHIYVACRRGASPVAAVTWKDSAESRRSRPRAHRQRVPPPAPPLPPTEPTGGR